MDNEVTTFAWDDEIVNDGQDRSFVTLEPGTYDYTVHKFERGHQNETDKLPACNKALVTIKISTDAGDCYITEGFPLCSKFEWKISSFFRSIGMKKHGEPLRMAWNESVGCTGRATITKDPGNKEGVFFNHVDSFLDPVKTEGTAWS